jgi:hypothetical protein
LDKLRLRIIGSHIKVPISFSSVSLLCLIVEATAGCRLVVRHLNSGLSHEVGALSPETHRNLLLCVGVLLGFYFLWLILLLFPVVIENVPLRCWLLMDLLVWLSHICFIRVSSHLLLSSGSSIWIFLSGRSIFLGFSCSCVWVLSLGRGFHLLLLHRLLTFLFVGVVKEIGHCVNKFCVAL